MPSPILNALPRDFFDLLSEFVAGGVEFLVIGGHAFNAYSAKQRATKDIDILLRPGSANLRKAAAALGAFGAPPHAVATLRAASASEIVFLGAPPLRIDFLQSIPSVDFDVAYERRTTLELDGLAIPLIALQDLIANKRAVGRPRDRKDVKVLETIGASPNASRDRKPSATSKRRTRR